MYWKSLRVATLLGVWTVVTIGAASAQSTITGVVKDTSGALLPGVTVEVASPALIEKVKTTTTDASGLYRVVDLRSGIYEVTFTLPGFTTVRRQGLELEANFTATVDTEMKVGAVEETVNVSGQAPLVDVQSTTRRDVLNRELVDTLPTGRSVFSAGNVLPGVTMGKFDVGGNSAMSNNFALLAAGSQSGDTRHLFDGLPVNSILGTGGNVPSYYNDDNFESTVYTIVGGNAESEAPGVQMNMIPKTGGNRFSGNVIGIYANSHFQSKNLDADLISKGVAAPASLSKLWDVNVSPGGPILKDRLWFFGSYRNWAYNNFAPNFFIDGKQIDDSNVLWTFSGRLTWQANAKNKFTVFDERYRKNRKYTGSENGLTDLSATGTQFQPIVYNAQGKWTSTATNRLLIEAGFSTNFFRNYTGLQPGHEAYPTPSNPLGKISRLDLNSQRLTNAPASGGNGWGSVKYLSSTMTYVAGVHEVKVGALFGWGRSEAMSTANGDIQEQYRCPPGVAAGPGCTPVQVLVRNTPTDAVVDLAGRLGIFAQDSWKIRRLTLNPGVRFDTFRGAIPEQNIGAGYFVPARHFDAIENLPNYKDWSFRFGAVYDLFGDSRTAIKGSAGKYMQSEQTSFQSKYNPLTSSTDTRTWSGARDERGLPTGLGPSQNANFGIRINQNPAADIERPYQMVYNLGMQRELRPGTSVSANWYRRQYYRMITTENLDVPLSAYTPLTIPDPRGNGQTITIYNLGRDFLGKIRYLDRNSPTNKNTYTGYDVSVTSRGQNGASIGGGVAIGHFVSEYCDVTDPNQLRFCDQSEYNIPWAPSYKMNGVYPLPYDFRVSGVLQSTVGFADGGCGSGSECQGVHDVGGTYLVTRSVVPTLVQSTVTGGNAGLGNPTAGVLLDPPGSNYLPRVTMLDLGFMRTFKARGISLIPQLDIFNVFNANTVLSVVTNFGSSFGKPVTTLTGRLARLRVTVRF